MSEKHRKVWSDCVLITISYNIVILENLFFVINENIVSMKINFIQFSIQYILQMIQKYS
jgi:hypothetical protein